METAKTEKRGESTVTSAPAEDAAAKPAKAGAPPVVEMLGVSKTYPGGTVAAVADMDLTIREGEFFSILGSSGSGKTTTLRMIAGFEQPSAGSVLLDGID